MLSEHKVILRRKQVLERIPLSYVQIRRLEKQGRFPARVLLGDEPTNHTYGAPCGWYEDEVDAWINSRIRAGGQRTGDDAVAS